MFTNFPQVTILPIMFGRPYESSMVSCCPFHRLINTKSVPSETKQKPIVEHSPISKPND